MSRTVGRVDFIARMNGDKMTSDAEKQGDRAGREAAAGFDKSWNKGYRDTLSQSGKDSYDAWKRNGSRDGDIYGKSLNQRLGKFLAEARKNFTDLRFNPGFLDDFATKSDNAIGNLQRQIVQLHREGEITTAQFRDAKDSVNQWVVSQRQGAEAAARNREAIRGLGQELSVLANRHQIQAAEAAEKHSQALNRLRIDLADLAHDAEKRRLNLISDRDNNLLARFRNGVQSLSGSLDGLNFSWSNMSHEARQWTLIIGAVLAGMQDISVLGSAAGAGIVAVGGAAASGIIGIGGLVATFVTLNKELEDLPAGLRPVAAQFQRFKSVFGELRTEIATSAFAEMPDTFDGLYRTLRATTPQMRQLGAVTGRLIADFERGIRPGTEAFGELTTLVSNAVPNFRRLGDTSGELGLALVRSFNRAQPLVVDLLQYVDRLVGRFDAFSRGTGFDVWIANAMVTGKAFGGLLDAVGRSLNDLVTPEAVGRTAEFMDNLSAFMPNLTLLLDNLGRLDVFGVAALALAEFGDALSPLAPSAGLLADAVRELAMTAIPGLADGLQVAATIMAPLIELAARLIDSLPPEVIYLISYAIGALAGSFAILKGAQAIGGAVDALRTFGDLARGLPAKMTGAVAVLGVGGLAGAVAAGALAFPSLIDGLIDYLDEVSGLDKAVAGAVRSNKGFISSLKETNPNLDYSADRVGLLLDAISQAGGSYKDITTAISDFGNMAVQTQSAAGSLVNSVSKIDESFAGLTVDQATQKFSAWKDEMGFTDSQARQLIELMPNLSATLQSASDSATGAAAGHDLLTIATGRSRDAMALQKAASQLAAEQLAALQGQSAVTGEAIDSLAEQIRGFGSATLSTREANRQMEQAVADLTESLATNGATLDITTAAGRANEAAVDDLAKSVLEQAAATVEQTGKQQDANRVIGEGRQRLIDMLGQFGITGDAANAYVDQLGLIPDNVNTAINLQDQAARSGVDRFIRDYSGRSIPIYIQQIPANGVGGRPVNVGQYANGGLLLDGARHIIAGEDGPEAIVPLNRDLARVDPAVRWLSAIAQGKSSATMASGGVVGTGRQVTVESGAIVVQEALDPYRTGNVILNDLIDRIQD